MVIQGMDQTRSTSGPTTVDLRITKPDDLPIPAPPYQVTVLDVLQTLRVHRNLWVVTMNYDFVCLDACTFLLGIPLVRSQPS